jgi:hypothetical protein
MKRLPNWTNRLPWVIYLALLAVLLRHTLRSFCQMQRWLGAAAYQRRTAASRPEPPSWTMSCSPRGKRRSGNHARRSALTEAAT